MCPCALSSQSQHLLLICGAVPIISVEYKSRISTLPLMVDAVQSLFVLRLCTTHSAHHIKGNVYYCFNSMSGLPVCFKAKRSWTNYCKPSAPWLMSLSCHIRRSDLLHHFWHFRIYNEWFRYHISWIFQCFTAVIGLSDSFFFIIII